MCMKKLLILIAIALTVSAQAQVIRLVNPILTPVTGAYIYSDTVTNSATNFLTNKVQVVGRGIGVTVETTVTKISGTVAGTMTLQVSNDGTNFKAIPTEETQTGVATATALDVASQTFTWRINKVPYRWYRISWTGTGTMAASFKADVYRIR